MFSVGIDRFVAAHRQLAQERGLADARHPCQ
jgi:hypothetical protein